jgi:hypothetical protein
MDNQQLIIQYENAVEIFINKITENGLLRDTLTQLWKISLIEANESVEIIKETTEDIKETTEDIKETMEDIKEDKPTKNTKEGRKLIESKLIEDKPKQQKYLEEFCRKLIMKKYRKKLIEYLFHIHPDDRWVFMEKIKFLKLAERRLYIESLFEIDEKFAVLEEEIFGTEEKLEKYTIKTKTIKTKTIKKHKDLYNYKMNNKSKSLIYQAFLRKIKQQPPSKRELIYLFFTGIGNIIEQQKINPTDTREMVWKNFFLYLDRCEIKENHKFINLLFDPNFDINKYVRE